MTDHENLKAWVHWKKREKDLSEDDQLFVKAVEDAISQAEMVPQLRKERDEAREGHLAEHQAAVDMFAKYDETRNQLAIALAALDAAGGEETKDGV